MSPAKRRTAPPQLSLAITAGLRALSDLTRPPRELTSGGLERGLREAAARHRGPEGQTTDGTAPPDPLATAAAAVRTACAHLATRDHVDAYLALLTAYDALPADARVPRPVKDAARPDHHDPNPEADVAAVARQALTDQAAVEQAVGILAETGDGSVERAHAVLHGHARRHGVVPAELAADIVAGRVEPAHLVDTGLPGADVEPAHVIDTGPACADDVSEAPSA